MRQRGRVPIGLLVIVFLCGAVAILGVLVTTNNILETFRGDRYNFDREMEKQDRIQEALDKRQRQGKEPAFVTDKRPFEKAADNGGGIERQDQVHEVPDNRKRQVKELNPDHSWSDDERLLGNPANDEFDRVIGKQDTTQQLLDKRK